MVRQSAGGGAGAHPLGLHRNQARDELEQLLLRRHHARLHGRRGKTTTLPGWIGRAASRQSVNVALQCGPDAVSGACEKSVVQQLSTMPAWLYRGGLCYPYLADKKEYKSDCLPSYPWNTTENFALYQAGTSLVDKTCGQMARYMGRLVSHYTAGGHRDECGH